METLPVVDPLFPQCPVRNVLARIAEKWTLLVLLTLHDAPAPLRFKQIAAAIPDISEKMLSKTLQQLCADGLARRQAYAEIPPRVEYALTPRAHTLMPHLEALVGWALNNLSQIVADRQAYADGRTPQPQ